MTVIDTATHAILAAVPSVGPTPDIDQLQGVLDEVPGSITMHHLVADAGFDSAYNHWLLRDYHGIRSTIPPEHGRPPKDPATLPTDKYRRLMKQRFNRRAYRHRPQNETVFSMIKRNLGSFLRAKTHRGRMRDIMLKVLTHNLALALLWVFYRAVMSPFQLLETVDSRVGPILVKQGRGGRIITLASMQGRHGFKDGSSYSASKWGIIGLTKSAALELGKYKITVNAVIPGLVDTPLTRNMPRWKAAVNAASLNPPAEPTEQQVIDAQLIDTPLQVPWLQPQDIAPAAVFLASDLGALVTGACYDVTGGDDAHNT